MRELHVWSSKRPVATVEDFNAEMDQLLHQSATFLAVDKETGQPIGFVQAANINQRDGWCFMRFYFAPEYRDHGSGAEACLAFIDYLFHDFSYRKIYMDVYELDRGFLSRAMEGALVEEGRFREHTWYDDRYWDMVRLALYRDAWPEVRGRLGLILGVGLEAAELLAEKQAKQDGSVDADP